MFYNLNIILRNLRRNGLYSVINIAGLAVSLTAVILIMLWVRDELSFDKFHTRWRITGSTECCRIMHTALISAGGCLPHRR